MNELQLGDTDAYREYFANNPAEWHTLDRMCRITISRFYRDRFVFDYFVSDALPALFENLSGKHIPTLRVWCCGCASGEEPYTIGIIWHCLLKEKYPDFDLEITATDIDPCLLERAGKACYSKSSIRFLPAELVSRSFSEINGMYCLNESLKQHVHFLLQDIRQDVPAGTFQLVLCRNLAFTYFDTQLQEQVLAGISRSMDPGGLLIIGGHESLPGKKQGFVQPVAHLPIFIKP